MVRILVASRRPWAAEALATSSYGTNLDQPLSAITFVSAAVKVVLPWSTCPIVPTFTCGFVRSNFPFDTASTSQKILKVAFGILRSFLHDGVGDIGRHFHVLRELHRIV